jgi:hypothetical protein
MDASLVFRPHSSIQYAGGGSVAASEQSRDQSAATRAESFHFHQSPAHESATASPARHGDGFGVGIGGSGVGGIIDDGAAASLLTHDINTLDRTQLEYLLEQFQPDQHKAPIRFFAAFASLFVACHVFVFAVC